MAERVNCRIYYVRGRVQGVGYRNFVQGCAARIGVNGYTRNLGDGRVEVLAQGSPDQLKELEGHLWRGPAWAQVIDVVEEETGIRDVKGFGIRA